MHCHKLVLAAAFVWTISVWFFAEDYLTYAEEHIRRALTFLTDNDPSLTNFNEPVNRSSSMINAITMGKIFASNHGRLGNVLFQYAMLLAVRNLTGRPVYFISTIELNPIFQGISIPILSHKPTDLKRLPTKTEEIPGVFQSNFIANIPNSDVVICCHFQAYKYFNFIQDTVKREFTFHKEIRNHSDAILKRARKDILGNSTANGVRYIGVHVRRGDLLRSHNYKEGYRVAEVSYFKKAKTYFHEIYSETLLFIVTSDDKEWVKSNLSGPDTYISDSNNAGDDLALLAACNDTIVSLSTFSWWAGFLGGGKSVYFKDGMVNGSEIHQLVRFEDRFFTSNWIAMGN